MSGKKLNETMPAGMILQKKIILFSKLFKDRSIEDLVALAEECGVDGYDLCVRPEYPINPDNAATKLVKAVEVFKKNGLAVPMITGNFDLLYPDHPTAVPILSAMDKADVRLIKLGYYNFDPLQQDYWQEVDSIRKAFEGWQKLGETHNVKICYHTHSNRCMGLNCGMLAHLIRGFDPRYIGAYIDPGHMIVEGEEFAVGVAIIREYLSIVGLKDFLLERTDNNNHGSISHTVVEAGRGMVNWTAVFSELSRIQYEGPLSIHCEFQVSQEEFLPAVKREVAFFKRMRDTATGNHDRARWCTSTGKRPA